MDHAHHVHHHARHGGPSHTGHGGESLNRIAFVATLNCLLGCAIGEVAGLFIGAGSARSAMWSAPRRHTGPREACHGIRRTLARHNCLCIRARESGAVMDLWQFRRDDEEVAVQVCGTVVADNVHRDSVRELMIAGVGVGRILEWDLQHDSRFAAGALVPALLEWTSLEVPPVTLLHPTSVRRIPRVRLFIDWVTQLFADIEHRRHAPEAASGVPRWVRVRRSRTSATP